MHLHFVEESSRVPELVGSGAYLLMALSLRQTGCNLLHLCFLTPFRHVSLVGHVVA